MWLHFVAYMVVAWVLMNLIPAAIEWLERLGTKPGSPPASSPPGPPMWNTTPEWLAEEDEIERLRVVHGYVKDWRIH